MSTSIRRRVEALEGGYNAEANAQSERFTIVERETARRCEKLGIPEPTEAKPDAFRNACDSAKPDDWGLLTPVERADWLIGYCLDAQ